MKQPKKRNLKSVRVYFKADDKMQMEVYNALQELHKSMGVSLSTAAGMSLRRGVPLVKGDWDEIMPKAKK